MKSNRDIFEELLRKYKNQKDDVDQKQKAYESAHHKWSEEDEKNGEMSEVTVILGQTLDKVTADLDRAKEGYDSLAHLVLKYYLL